MLNTVIFSFIFFFPSATGHTSETRAGTGYKTPVLIGPSRMNPPNVYDPISLYAVN